MLATVALHLVAFVVATGLTVAGVRISAALWWCEDCELDLGSNAIAVPRRMAVATGGVDEPR